VSRYAENDLKFDLILHNGIIVTINPAFEILSDGYVAVKNGRIQAIGTKPKKGLPKAVRVVDAQGGIILPGLVNTHTHLPMTLFRGLADDLPLAVWLEKHIFPAESAHVTPTNVYHGALLGCAELLLGGTTTICDGYFFEDQVAQAVLEAGLRAVMGQGVIDYPAPGVSDPAENIRTAAAFVARYRDRSPLVKPSVFCHSPYTCSAATLQQAKALAAANGILFQIHVAETREENRAPYAKKHGSVVRYLDRHELLDRHTLLVHAVWVDATDIALLADRGCGISHNPESNMKLAAGVAPVPQFLAAGLAVGLGTDGCASNNDMDLFHEMDIAAKLHKVHLRDAVVMDAATVLKMVTIDAARAIGMAAEIGSLEVGKAADIIVVDTRKPHLTPLYNPDSQLVYAARSADVSHVMIAGRFLVEKRRLLHLDLPSIVAQVHRLSRSIGS
jgi:5-methylthioadenosine/S-adenosylhomocysteine deaminase